MYETERALLKPRQRALVDHIQHLAFIASRRAIVRYTTCTKAVCRCHADPPQRHGPYQQYTRKVAGKTVTVRLTPEQAQRYREQIANRRRLDELIAAMEDVSAQARDVLLQPSNRQPRQAGHPS